MRSIYRALRFYGYLAILSSVFLGVLYLGFLLLRDKDMFVLNLLQGKKPPNPLLVVGFSSAWLINLALNLWKFAVSRSKRNLSLLLDSVSLLLVFVGMSLVAFSYRHLLLVLACLILGMSIILEMVSWCRNKKKMLFRLTAREVLQQWQHGVRDFRQIDLFGETLRGADLEGADFSYSDLREVDLRDANLHKAILKETLLVGSNMERARITNEQLREASLLKDVIMPDGSRFG